MGQGSSGWYDGEDEEDAQDALPMQAEDRASQDLQSPDFQKPEEDAPEEPGDIPPPQPLGNTVIADAPEPVLHQRRVGDRAEARVQARDQKIEAANERRYERAVKQAGVVGANSDGSPVFKPGTGAPQQTEDGRWVREARDAQGQRQLVDMRDPQLSPTKRMKVDRTTGETYFDEGGMRVVTGTDQATVDRVNMLTERKRLQAENSMDMAMLATERHALNESKKQLKQFGSTPAQYETQLRNLEMAIAGKSEDAPEVRRYREVSEAWAKWQQQNPEYRKVRAQFDAADANISSREQAVLDRRIRAAALMGNGTGAAIAGTVGDVGIQPIIRGDDADAKSLAAWAAMKGVEANSSQTTAHLQAVTELANQGVKTVRGRPIEQVIEELQAKEDAEKVPIAVPSEPSDDGDFVRGAKVSLKQLAPLAKGTLALIGATAEKVAGKGGLSTKLKDWGLRGYRDGMAETEKISKENDDVSVAWRKAQAGDIGALIDWAQYGAGYLVGQAGETLAIAALGALAGSTAAPGAGTVAGAVTGGVAKTATKATIRTLIEGIVERTALKQVTAAAEKQGVKMTAEQLAKAAATSEARKQATATIGRNVAVAANSLMMEAGTIFPEAVNTAAKEGKELNGADLAKVWGTSILAGGVDALTDKLGLDVAAGKIRLGGGNRLATAAKMGVAGSLIEGGTEGVQTLLERYGSGQSLADADAQSDYINSIALGALGGGAVGAFGGARNPADPGTVQQPTEPAPPTTAQISDAYDDAIAKARTARESGDLVAHAEHMDAAQKLLAGTHEVAAAETRQVPDAARKAIAKAADAASDFKAEQAALVSDPATFFATAEIGRNLRDVYGNPQVFERAVMATGADPAVAETIHDQHLAFAAARDLQKVLDGQRLAPEREQALASLGLLDTQDDGTVAVTDDATPLLSPTTREAVRVNPGAFGPRYMVTPDATGNGWTALVSAGRQRIAQVFSQPAATTATAQQAPAEPPPLPTGPEGAPAASGDNPPTEPPGEQSATPNAQSEPSAAPTLPPAISEFIKRYGKQYKGGVTIDTEKEYGSGGVAVSPDGSRFFVYTRDLESALNAIPEAQREKFVRAMLDEELRHLADVRVNSDAETSALWHDLPESIQEATQSIYTRERRESDPLWDKMTPVSWGREYKRLLSQQTETGETSELAQVTMDEIAKGGQQAWVKRLLTHLRKMLAWLKSHDASTDQLRRLHDELARIRSTANTPTESRAVESFSPKSAGGDFEGHSSFDPFVEANERDERPLSEREDIRAALSEGLIGTGGIRATGTILNQPLSSFLTPTVILSGEPTVQDAVDSELLTITPDDILEVVLSEREQQGAEEQMRDEGAEEAAAEMQRAEGYRSLREAIALKGGISSTASNVGRNWGEELRRVRIALDSFNARAKRNRTPGVFPSALFRREGLTPDELAHQHFGGRFGDGNALLAALEDELASAKTIWVDPSEGGDVSYEREAGYVASSAPVDRLHPHRLAERHQWVVSERRDRAEAIRSLNLEAILGPTVSDAQVFDYAAKAQARVADLVESGTIQSHTFVPSNWLPIYRADYRQKASIYAKALNQLFAAISAKAAPAREPVFFASRPRETGNMELDFEGLKDAPPKARNLAKVWQRLTNKLTRGERLTQPEEEAYRAAEHELGQQYLLDAPTEAPRTDTTQQEIAARAAKRLVAGPMEDQRDLLTGRAEDKQGNQMLFASAAVTPKYKSLWVDRSGNVHGSMSAMAHDDILKRFGGFVGLPQAERERRGRLAMTRGRVLGETLHLEESSVKLTPPQRRFADQFASEHGLNVKTNDRVLFDHRHDAERDTDTLFAAAPVDEHGVHRLAKPRGTANMTADEQRHDPAHILASLLRGSDEAGSRQPWKHGRKIASHSEFVAWASGAGYRLDQVPVSPADEGKLAPLESSAVGGGEHIVRYDPQAGRWIKLTKPGLYGAQGDDAGAYLQRWALANRVFNDDVRFEGIVTLTGEDEPRAVISQPDRTGRDSTVPEQIDYLRSKGFREAGGFNFIHPVTGLRVWDSQTDGNAITGADGTVMPIDLQIEPASSEDLARVRDESGIGLDRVFAGSPVKTGGNWTQQAILPMTMTRGGNAAPIDIKERYRLHRLAAGAWESAADVFERTQNPVGQALGRKLSDYTDTKASVTGHLEARFENVLAEQKKADVKRAKDEFKSYFKARENGDKKLAASLRTGMSPLANNLVQTWEKVAVDTGKKARALNIQVWDSALNGGAGGYRLIGNLGTEYFPRQMRDEVWKVIDDPDSNPKVRRQLEDALIHAGWDPARARAFFELEAPKLFDRNDFFGALEMARKHQLPEEFYEYDFDKTVPNYIDRFAQRAAQIRHFGQKLTKLDPNDPKNQDYFDKALKDAANGATRDYIEATRKQVYGIRERGVGWKALSTLRVLASGLLLSNPFTTVPRNVISGLFSTAEQLGAGRSLAALKNILKGTVPKLDAVDLGVIRGAMLDAAQYVDPELDVSGVVRKVTGMLLKASGYNASEEFLRWHAAATAMVYVQDYLRNPNSSRAKEAEAFMERIGIDPAKLRSEAGDFAQGKETRRFLRRAVKETQFGYDVDQVPIWGNSPLGRLLYQFGRWGMQRTRALWKHVFEPAIFGRWKDVHGKRYRVRNYNGLARLLTTVPLRTAGVAGSAVLTGEMFSALAALFFDRDRDDASLEEIVKTTDRDRTKGLAKAGERAINDLMISGMLGILGQPLDFYRAWFQGARFKNPLEPPVSAIPRALGEFALSAKERGAPINIDDFKAGLLSDAANAAGAMMPGARSAAMTTSNLAAKLGLHVRAIEVEEAERQVRNLRKAANRFAKENGLEAGGGISFDRTPKKPISATMDRIQDSLLIGDWLEAQRAAEQYISTLPIDQQAKVRNSIKLSINARQPIRVGPYRSEDVQQSFISWARENLSARHVSEIANVQQRYREASEAGEF